MRSKFLAAALLVLIPGPVIADNCDDYAAQAVADVVEAEHLGCAGLASDENFVEGPISFKGPRWSTNLAQHANWCRTHGGETSPLSWDNGATMAHSEESQRRRAMLFCTVCNNAATEAAKLAQQAVDLHCGFTGDEWDNRFAAQMAACFKQGWSSALWVLWPNMDQENKDRAEKVAACKLEAFTRGKLPAGNSRYTRRPDPESRVGNKGNTVKDVVSDPHCLHCKSSKSGAPR